MDNKKSNIIKECEICESNATCLCFQCNNYFCESCYKMIHDKAKKGSHKKEIIDPFVPIDLKCPYHPKDRINLFCANEKGMSISTLKNYIFYQII